MKKAIFAVLSLLIVTMFLVGCTQEGEKVDVVDEQGNIVGEAFRYAPGKYRLPQKLPSKEVLKPKLFILKEIITLHDNSCETDADCSGCAKCFNGVCEKPGCLGPTGDDYEVGMGFIGDAPITGQISVCEEESCPSGYWPIGGGGGGTCCATWDECNSDDDCDSNFCVTQNVKESYPNIFGTGSIGNFCDSCFKSGTDLCQDNKICQQGICI